MGNVFFQEIKPNQSPISTYGKIIPTIRSSQALPGKYDQDRKMCSAFLEYQNYSFFFCRTPVKLKWEGWNLKGGITWKFEATLNLCSKPLKGLVIPAEIWSCHEDQARQKWPGCVPDVFQMCSRCQGHITQPKIRDKKPQHPFINEKLFSREHHRWSSCLHSGWSHPWAFYTSNPSKILQRGFADLWFYSKPRAVWKAFPSTLAREILQWINSWIKPENLFTRSVSVFSR